VTKTLALFMGRLYTSTPATLVPTKSWKSPGSALFVEKRSFALWKSLSFKVLGNTILLFPWLIDVLIHRWKINISYLYIHTSGACIIKWNSLVIWQFEFEGLGKKFTRCKLFLSTTSSSSTFSECIWSTWTQKLY